MDLSGTAYVDLPEKVEGKRSLIERGDLLMTITGANVGKVAHVNFDISEAYVSQSVALMKYVLKQFGPYLHYYFQSSTTGAKYVGAMVYGVGRPVLSLDNMRDVPVPVCSLPEQHAIVREIESRLSVCDKVEQAITESLEKAESLRQSILKKAFEGELLTQAEIEACKQEADYEPASVMLERIKAEREKVAKPSKLDKKRVATKKIAPKASADVQAGQKNKAVAAVSGAAYYKRILLAAEIVWQLHMEPTLGHLKLQKLIYLCQESEHMQLPTNFLRQAAGPYDPKMARAIDKQMKMKKLFVYQQDSVPKYIRLENAGAHHADFNKYFSDNISGIQHIINLFRKEKSEKLEIVATLYACWKNIIEENTDFSDKLLIKYFYDWSPEKSKYPEVKLVQEIYWMKREELVPI